MMDSLRIRGDWAGVPRQMGGIVVAISLIIELQTMLTAQQMQKNTQAFFSQIYATDAYEQVKQVLYAWRDRNKSPPQAISTFLKILQIISTQQPEMLEDLNRCLVKEYSPSSHPPSLTKIRQLAADNPNAVSILDTVINWLKSQQLPVQNGSMPKAPQLEELSQAEFMIRLQKHERCKDISKIVLLYRRCVLTLSEFKKLLEPIYLSDPSFFNMLFQYAQELEARRRKVTIFAPLNELVDQKYPLEQVGNSYIFIPDGYSNWGKSWAKNPLESVFNRVCVSVPLGTEGSFVITRKNQFEEQLLRNEEEKYEIDSNLVSLKAAISLIDKTNKLSHPLVIKILSNIYTTEVVGIMMRSIHADVARIIVLPRLRQKLAELTRCRAKFEKVCEEVASKNFYKSLDYRCFYFCKNDKKFNCIARWEKEIELRKKEVIEEEINHLKELKIEDRESLQHSRHYTLNSFDNITNQQLLTIKTMEFGERHIDAAYPPFPHNQVLFLLDFSQSTILNDVLQIVLYHTQKKTLLELIIFKLLRLPIERNLQKQAGTLQFIEGKTTDWQNINEPLNETKPNKRVYKDLTDEFLDLIEEDIQPAQTQPQEFPFEGPEEHTFIGTKQCYFFVRYLLTIYQRFLRAKSLSSERGNRPEEPSLYVQFLSVMIHKIKEQKGLEEYLRKIFQQDAYIFFTLDKLILGLVKLINNINADSLTYKILRDDMRDYELQIKRWSDYVHPSVTQQLTRLYRERELLFRFSYSSTEKLFFISAWENYQTFDADKKKKEGQGFIDRNIEVFMNDPVPYSKEPATKKCFQSNKNEYLQDQLGYLAMRGEEELVNKRKAPYNLSDYEKELMRVKKLKLS